MGNKAVFLDRDGTIAEDVNYCRRVEDFHILPTVPEAIRLFNRMGFKVVVITNQSGLTRGFFDESTLESIHQKMYRELIYHGAKVDALYYCPHHPDDGCACRKPQTGLFKKAAFELDIDLSASYMIGDRQMDIEAGKAAGCKTILVQTGPTQGRDVSVTPDYAASYLYKAAQWVLEQTIMPFKTKKELR